MNKLTKSNEQIELEKLKTKLIHALTAIGWLNTMDPPDKPSYHFFVKQVKELQRLIEEAKENDSSLNNK